MSGISRRAFLGAGGALAATTLLAACGGGSGGSGGGSGLRWWDHYSALQNFHKDWAERQSQALGVGVDYTYNDVTRASEALQLANQSKQLPDVYTNILNIPLAALVREGWVHELALSDEVKARLPEGALTEGITNIDGKVYGLPLFAFRQYSAATWFNRDIVAAAGIDPANPPTSYDAYRDACRRISASGTAPMMLALGGKARMGEQINDMACAAGFPGFEGLVFATGEFAFHHDAYVTAIEFWKELNDTRLIVPGAINFTVANARTRWAAGTAGFFPDGPWCAGGVRAVNPEFVPTMEVGPILTPEPGAQPVVYRGAPASQIFVAGNTKDAAHATELVSSFTTPEYQAGLAAGMDQPPLDLDIVATADVTDPYRRVIGFFTEQVKRMPEPVVRNPQVAAVQALQAPISPDLGDIVQGYLGGDIPDLRAALRQLSDAYTADRDNALQKAAAGGAQVSAEDWAFPDWQPGTDYVYA
jgi:ABC-type glycerol-3-phosphate transport system substrate-binding protein